MPKPDCGPERFQTEALVLTQAFCQRDAFRATAALSYIYAQMDEWGLLAPHAYAIEAHLGSATCVQAVHQALLYLWYLRGFEALAKSRNFTNDHEEAEP